ncbi:MAG: phosphoglycerate dehydrogenase [Rickettsiales bacterium]|jgi:D-3-phosphoglycerate dehydrogenase / 2-oxoglutarate reductase|nr:phosphoglycerate dehydrogenase [Rickettsiales bacterium]
MKQRILVSNIMMLKERERFQAILESHDLEPIFPKVGQFLSEAELLGYAGNIDAMLAGDDHITRHFLEKAVPRLKVISKWGTGIDSIDLSAAKELGIKVCNSPAAFSDAVADVALGYIIDLYRSISLIDRQVRSGAWPKPTGFVLRGKTLGMIGFGAIGRAIAERAKAFGMDVVYFDVKQGDAMQGASFVKTEEVFKQSDVICLACNLTADNHHLIDSKAISLMKNDVKIVNVARGPLIKEVDLIAALEQESIGGVALDVFEDEPICQSSGLLKFNNTIFGSHNANNAFEANEYVHQNTINNLLDGLGKL